MIASSKFTHCSSRIFAIVAVFMINACSFYQVGQQKPSELEEVQSIYIATPVVAINPTITQAPIYFKNHLHTALMHKAPYQLASKDTADATLIIKISDQSTNTIQRSNDNLLRGSAYKLKLKSTWKVVKGNQILLSGTINEEALFVAQDPNNTNNLTTLERSSWTLAHQEAVKQALESISNKVATELMLNF